MKYFYLSLLIMGLIAGVAHANSVPVSIGGIKLGAKIDDARSNGYETALSSLSFIKRFDVKVSRIKPLWIKERRGPQVGGAIKQSREHDGSPQLYGIRAYNLIKRGTDDASFHVCETDKVFYMEMKLDETSKKLLDEMDNELKNVSQLKKIDYDSNSHGFVHSGRVYMNEDVTWILEIKGNQGSEIILYDTKAIEKLLESERLENELKAIRKKLKKKTLQEH